MKRHNLKRLILLLIFLIVFPSAHSTADLLEQRNMAYTDPVPTDESYENLFEAGLSIYEMEREITNLSEEQTIAEKNIVTIQDKMNKHEKVLDKLHIQVGEILRAYYMGHRPSPLELILSSGSITEAFQTLLFTSQIIQHDDSKINKLQTAQTELEGMEEQLITTYNEITLKKEQLITQKRIKQSLEEQFSSQVSGLEDSEAFLKDMDTVIHNWETQGLPLFGFYFKQLSIAMNDFSELIFQHKDSIETDGNEITFTISEDQLQQYFISKNEIFSNLQFSFSDNKLIAQGEDQGVKLYLEGELVIVEEPTHKVQFQAIQIKYNDFILPAVTAENFTSQYDLSFYPQVFVESIVVTNITMEKGSFSITVNMDWKDLFF
ncbi:coiled-coil domain-containing protein [Longirhabdus pacifica]|uniref:coiled-coil domain-containing protein n=1 Tax=Longirhabdus pacifica TaxID=2305227 RepID=UPI0010092C31|nr:hypothetical protein [Longirhabdus pacifica]